MKEREWCDDLRLQGAVKRGALLMSGHKTQHRPESRKKEYHDHVLLSHKKMETQAKKISHFPVSPVMTSNNKSPKHTHTRHLTAIEASSPDHNTASPYHSHQDIPCRLAPCQSNTPQSHTKPSARSQTSIATMAMTGMNSVRARTLIELLRRPPRRRKRRRSEQNKTLPK